MQQLSTVCSGVPLIQLYANTESFNMNTMFSIANSCSGNEYDLKISTIIEHIFSNEFKIDVQVMQNHKYIQQILNILSNIPQLQEINKHKVTIPEFDEIEVMKGDSAEIKKFIRKANYDFLGFHCNHKTIDKNYEKFDALIADIYSSADFVEYRRIYREIGTFIHNITKYDKLGKDAQRESGDHYVEDTESNAKKLVDLIIKINSKIISANSTLIKECSKCKATVKKYNYVIKEVQRMREEYHEQLNPSTDDDQDLPAENTYSILQFLNDEFPTVDRFPLSDVKNRYKQKFGLSLTIQEMKTKLEETNMFTITRCKNKYYVNRK